MSRITIALIAFIFASLPIGPVAEAAEIKVFALQSPQIVINEVGADFERSTGHKITQLLRRTDIKPDISSVEAFKRALLNAKSIAYLAGGTSGPYLATLVERLGIAAELLPKTKRPDTDIVGDLVARGEAELGVTAIIYPHGYTRRRSCRPAPARDPILRSL